MAVLPPMGSASLAVEASSTWEAPVTWEALFGGRTFCACRECQSAYGPAAYLADLLFWLRSRDASGTFLTRLLERRPDLGELELSCKNAHTALPAIDLVLERLEAIVEPEGASPAVQTTLDEDELAARPEHVHAPAYEVLAGEDVHPIFYPFEQPYVGALDQTRTFLRSLGIDRSTALVTLAEARPSEALAVPEVAAEALGMTRTSWAILSGQRVAATAERWGLRRDLFRPHPAWSSDGPVPVTAQPDPDGGTSAVELSDLSAGDTQSASIVSTRYRGGPITGSLYVKKDPGASSFVEIRLGFDGSYADAAYAFALHLGSGALDGTGWTTLGAVEESGWWRVTFARAGVETAGRIGLRVSPAAGTEFPTRSGAAMGTATVYAPRLAIDWPISSLEDVGTFLRQAGDRGAEQPLGYAELEDLLRSQYVQDAGELAIWFDNLVCDVAGAVLVSASLDDHLKRLAKLVRLARDLGWPVRDVDRAISVFRTSSAPAPLQESDLSEPLLLNLAAVRWLERTLGLSAPELLDWWGALDTRRWHERLKDGAPSTGGPWPDTGRGRVPNPLHANAGGSEAEASPFQRLVRLHGAEEEFRVLDDGSELVDATRDITAHADAVAAILGVEPRELVPLVKALVPDGAPSPALVTLASLSRLHRQVGLARALGLSTSELLEWTSWLGADPFASPRALVRFVVEVRRNASVRVGHGMLSTLVAGRGTRDLSSLGLPSMGVALLALAEEARAHQAVSESTVFDMSTLQERNLLPAPAEVVWTPADGATLETAVLDPTGGADAVVVTDPSDTQSAHVLALSPSGAYSTATPVWGSLWIRKSPAASHFVEVGVVYGTTTAARLALHLGTGETEIQAGSFEEIAVRDAGDWWFLAWRHAGGVGSEVGLVVYPAAGPVAAELTGAVGTTGSATIYGARVAEATTDAASPLYPFAARDRALVHRTAALLHLDVALVTRLLTSTEYLVPASTGRVPAFDKLLEATLLVAARRDEAPVQSASPEEVEAALVAAGIPLDVWELVAVTGWLCRALGIRVEDLGWLLDAATARRGFDLEAIVFGAAVPERYAAWASLREAARLQQVGRDGHILDLLGSWLEEPPASAAQLRAALASRTSWTEADLAALIQDGFGGPLGGTSAASWAEPGRFTRLAAWMELARGLRVPASQLVEWAQRVWPEDAARTEPVGAYEAQARAIEETLRGAWGRERWLAEMPGMRDELRSRQRHALVSRLAGDPAYPDFDSSAAIGDALLMDAQMGACARTSRLKDAIRTVQVFVQRILVGAEGDLRLNEEEAREWQWRKSFRVWEANRKVFLYPENWLRPELRGDKTPFFEALEGELASADLREEFVEDAYRAYLRKLTEVSKLDTLAVLRQVRPAGSDVYHVFARTRSIPQTYYHREWVDGGRWTPWREIPKVEGEHLLPVIYQRRLMLFWLNISDSALEPGTMVIPTFDDEVPASERYFNIRVSWSEHRDGRWSAPSRSDAFIGADERGRVSVASPLLDLVSSSVDAGGRRVTFPSTVLHAHVSEDERTHDLLIRVYREHLDQRIAKLPVFRVSGVDGQVSVEVESRSSSVSHSTPPTRFDGGAYHGVAQRFVRRGDGEYPLDLWLPLPHASAPGAVRAEVLDREPVLSSDDWIQITPSDRVRFDATAPLVFEDNASSYWVTYAPIHQPTIFFSPIGFGGSFWYGADADLQLPPPRLEGLTDSTMELGDAGEVPRLKWAPQSGTDALIEDAAIREIQSSGKNIVAINSSGTDKSSRKYAVNGVFSVQSAEGDTLFTARAGVTSDADQVLEVVWTYESPPVPHEPSPTSEGFHFLQGPRASWHFQTFFHPHVRAMRETLNRVGVFGLLDPRPAEPLAGQAPEPETTLDERYVLTGVSHVPADDLDFSTAGAYAQYNWELFFHAPFLIACRLHEAGRFEEALKWLRVIFDPYRPAQAGESADEATRSYWRFRPFREEFASGTSAPRNIQQLLAVLTASASNPAALGDARDLLQQILDWRRNPFDPHAIARTRIVTYMASVVMKFLEVLLDWGDELFAQDTLESVGEAAELFFLAARILGPRPEAVGVGEGEPSTFSELVARFESGVGPAESVEEALTVDTWEVLDDELPTEADSLASLLYFCTPANPQLTTRFWDRVADRLFKIRNCLDLQGRRRELELFEPPIDPDLLVRAAASGVDLRTLLSDVVTGRVPHRRYLAMADLAAGLVASAQALGQALVVAIEKRDADQLALLRSTHERRLQEDSIKAREGQIADVGHQLDALRRNREATARRLAFYKDRPRTNTKEAMQLSKARNAKDFSDAAGVLSATAAIVGLIPELDIGSAGMGGSPKVTAAFGGKALAAVARASAHSYEAIAAALERAGRLLLAESGYDRRQEEWRFQADLAQKDLEAIDARLLAMEVQLALARDALATAELRMEQIEEVHDVLERRFAREELYDWLASQLSGLHYQSYQLAYEFAKKAEKAWQYELGRNDSFIQFGYWDSRRKGLLAADRLGHDLRRMQVEYMELSKRRLEVDQTFSLRDLDPLALLRLQVKGTAELTLPEAFYDLYYPGQYGRRVRAVRLTIPAVVPPNTNLPVHVELLRHWVRKAPPAPGGIPAAGLVEGGYGSTPVAMTSTSTGQRDAGVFELDFRGPRLLPFEGAGAVSRWRLTLPKAVRAFNYRDIQDVLVHVAYDAEYSGTLRDALEAGPASPAFTRLFSTEATAPERRRVISLRSEHGSLL
ncbi:MAG: hypothetical protein IT378_11255, partial [Sandaracinaceae bacterium]|nr:hypothetical protein [Sandaracinaceae bacterium]